MGNTLLNQFFIFYYIFIICFCLKILYCEINVNAHLKMSYTSVFVNTNITTVELDGEGLGH